MAHRLKIFTLNWRNWRSVAEGLGLGLKWLICTIDRWWYYPDIQNTCKIVGPWAPFRTAGPRYFVPALPIALVSLLMKRSVNRTLFHRTRKFVRKSSWPVPQKGGKGFVSVTGRRGTGSVVWCCEGERRGVIRTLHSLKVRRATSLLVTDGVRTYDADEPALREDNLVITWLVQVFWAFLVDDWRLLTAASSD
jgi:hypothetical protein